MPSANFAAQSLGYWNATAAARYPDKIAIYDLSRDPPREISYADLESRLDRVASTLTRLGVKPGDRLAMSISNRVEFVETMFCRDPSWPENFALLSAKAIKLENIEWSNSHVEWLFLNA